MTPIILEEPSKLTGLGLPEKELVFLQGITPFRRHGAFLQATPKMIQKQFPLSRQLRNPGVWDSLVWRLDRNAGQMRPMRQGVGHSIYVLEYGGGLS